MSTERYSRKLTAILSADVKGYSRLMGEDEEATVQTLTAYRDVMVTLIQKHRGRVVDSPGDNVLAEFASVVDAVRSAVEIQEELRARNAELPQHQRMEFRIGVNLGDVIVEGGRIYGDGVNVAARVEGLAHVLRVRSCCSLRSCSCKPDVSFLPTLAPLPFDSLPGGLRRRLRCRRFARLLTLEIGIACAQAVAGW